VQNEFFIRLITITNRSAVDTLSPPQSPYHVTLHHVVSQTWLKEHPKYTKLYTHWDFSADDDDPDVVMDDKRERPYGTALDTGE